MKYIRNLMIPFFLLNAFVFYSCKNNWEDHNKLNDASTSENLLEKIQTQTDLGRFVQYLKVTGYDQVLASSQAYTVWAPVDAAFEDIDTSYFIAGDVVAVEDTNKLKKLKQFVANHISLQEYSYFDTKSISRILMLNGKYISILNDGAQIESANLVAPNDRFCRNGVLHVVDKVLAPRLNIWDYLMSSNYGQTFKTYISQFDQKVFDRDNSRRIGVDRAQGLPIYDSVFIWSNRFILNYASLNDEDSVYTTFILTDAALQAEKDRYRTFFTMSTAAKTDSVLLWNLYKDFVFKGKYTLGSLPNTLESVDGVNVPIDKGAIIDSYEASNGMVYVLNGCSLPYENKFKPIIVDVDAWNWSVSANNSSYYYRYGEGYSSSAPSNAVKRRFRPFALNEYDFLFSGYSGTKGVVSLPVNLYANLSYKFYWVAVNDFSATPIAQSMSLNGNAPTMWPPDSIRYTPYPNQPAYLNEVYLGEATSTNYNSYGVKVYSGFGTTNSATNIVLDYIKIVPVLQ